MDDQNIEHLRDWLDLTNQQFDILKSVYTLERKKGDTSPLNIQKEYFKRSGKRIERSNLFTIIKLLVGRDTIQKTERGRYSLNIEGIKKSVDVKDRQFKEQYNQLQKARQNLDSYLNDILEQPPKPVIRFLSNHELFNTLAERLKYASELCLSVRSPSLACSPTFYKALERGEYHRIITQRALIERDLKVKWLLDFNVNRQFDRVLKLFNSSEFAYMEVNNQIEGIEKIVNEYDNVEFYSLSYPYTQKFFLPITNRVNECFMYLTGFSSLSSQGAIHILSEDIASEVLKIFNSECLASTKLTPNNVKKYTDQNKKTLKQHISK